jgi:hypothetical protein
VRQDPQLRIEQHIQGYQCAFLSKFPDTMPWGLFMPNNHNGRVHFEPTFSWIKGAYKVNCQAIPKGSISLIFKSDGNDAFFSALTKAVHMKNFALETHHRGITSRPPVNQHPLFGEFDFPSPWDLPDWLPSIVDDLNKGPVHGIIYNGQMAGYDWAKDEHDSMAWSTRWRNFYEHIRHVVNLSGGGMREYWYDSM